MRVVIITPSDASIFPEYIIPNIKHLVKDPEVIVRSTYAQCIVQLADTALKYLEMGQALKAHGAFQMSQETSGSEEAHLEVRIIVFDTNNFWEWWQISYDASLSDLQSIMQEQLSSLLTDSSSVVKRAVLHNMSSLCIFLGRQKTNDVLLMHMITYLNDRDWLLRFAFYESIVDVAACAGGRSLEEYILPLMIQGLSGPWDTHNSSLLLIQSRRGGKCRCPGLSRPFQLVRTGIVSKNAYLGAYECNTRLSVSSKCVDTPGCVQEPPILRLSLTIP